MRKLVPLVIGAALATGVPLAAGSGAGRLPNVASVRACAAAGPYWPTMTLALSGDTAWVACKEQSRIVRMALPGGRSTATVALDAPVIAVATGFGAVWALDSSSTLYRLDARRARVTKRIRLDANAAYNIWLGAGSVWVADDQGARVLRVSPATNRVVARIAVGDGPADMVFAGTRAWLLTHRDNTLYRIDATSNAATRLSTLGGERRGSRAPGAPRRPPLDHRARRPAARGRSRDAARPGRRSTSAGRGSTSSPRPARSGFRPGRSPSTAPAFPRWRRFDESRPGAP